MTQIDEYYLELVGFNGIINEGGILQYEKTFSVGKLVLIPNGKSYLPKLKVDQSPQLSHLNDYDTFRTHIDNNGEISFEQIMNTDDLSLIIAHLDKGHVIF